MATSTDLTVAAVVEFDGKFLIVEEYASGRRVLTQPGGHIEAGESPEQAVERETLEESGCHVSCDDLIGAYLWIHPQSRQQYLRLAYRASYLDVDESLTLDDGIVRRRWLTLDELRSRRAMLRSPAVLQCVRDFTAGRRPALDIPSNLLSLERDANRIIAVANHL
jgi:8-oxo-dGTP pyrophosphatase MutT (NUDIX family)